MRPAPKRSVVGVKLRGMLKRTVMKQRRDTVYHMLHKKHSGMVPCFVCGKHVPKPLATLEHVRPLSKGGTDAMSNLSISHGHCNSARGNNV